MRTKSYFSTDELNSSIAKRNGKYLTVDNKPGFIFFGPYEAILPGRYRFNIDFQYQGLADQLGRWDVVIHQADNTTALAAANWKSSASSITATFEVPVSLSLGKIEIRPYFNGDGKIQTSGLTISRID